MKISIEFEDEQSALDAINGWRYKNLINDLSNWLRSQVKYSDNNELQVVREKLHELLSEDNLSLFD
jgi:hypothetical protein